MSSPISSLKKSKKTALPGGHGQRAVPFRFPDYTDEEKLLTEMTGQSPSSRLSNYSLLSENTNRMRESLPGLQLPKLSNTSSSKSTSPPNDYELMTSMMNKIALLEKKVTFYSKEIIEKDKKIKILEEKCLLLGKYKGSNSEESARIKELEQKCLVLQNQVYEMEEFLADYGMVWVGDSSKTNEDNNRYDVLTESSDEEHQDTDVWRPATSLAKPAFHVDFNKVIENIKELNILAGEGVQRIQKTIGGARLRAPEPITLTLYANGIFMFNGPFRSYEEPETQLCVQDLMDGYFPSELQTRYPEGIPMLVTDKRDVIFEDKRHKDHFPGTGQVLGGDHKPSVLLPTNLDKSTNTKYESDKSSHVTSDIPVPKLTVDQFLSKLPKSVIKEGKVIDIRTSIGETFKSDKGQANITVIDTPVLREMKERVEKPSTKRPKSARDVTTLRIKSETGDKTFILRMKFTDTIGELRQYLNSQRASATSKYDILTTFPNRTYSDNNATLEDCGLVPNATLHLKAKR
ncbi:UBX domain-containing protein 11-like isoform X2 [Ptychodera flava]|uniref:UBX domain-containing protein 11-like isoform X2 n=1 Tax=Ptychodera flava TaxID=63121 RepID=UPI00396A3CD8